ncbi:WD repeat containing protein 55 [Fasciola hepatica]|uniref:WD repeat containing protein 55 n=1 Tax=Fasciola hepatica TaxID=6192 RepID=A0A4E0RY81_FASHE|nr:WD repeat containing protein 55 [Fasciola hepatica]
MYTHINVPIGIDGISSVCYSPDSTKPYLAVGTNTGRLRLFNCSAQNEPLCVYRSRWHKSIRGLAFFPSAPNLLLSTSSHSGIKIHDMETQKRVWLSLKAHGHVPISAVIVTDENQWATGDENGTVQLWDRRQPGPRIVIERKDEEQPSELVFSTINDLAVGSNCTKWLYAATDDGCLAVYNLRRRRLDVLSDTLGYSARSVAVVHGGKYIVVGTEEGVLCQFTLNEFETCSERFSLRPDARSPHGHTTIEKIVAITDNLLAVASDDGCIHAINVMPNRYLGLVGRHRNLQSPDVTSSGDCMDLSVNSDCTLLASGCPAIQTVCFWPLAQWTTTSCNASNFKRKKRTALLDPVQQDYMSGLLSNTNCQVPESEGRSGDDSDSDDDVINSDSE